MNISLKAPVADLSVLAIQMCILHMDLRSLGEARQLLVGRLCGHDSRSIWPQSIHSHREMVLEERMELHEASPGLVEHDVLAQRPQLFHQHIYVVNGAVVGAIFDHRNPERTLAAARPLDP